MSRLVSWVLVLATSGCAAARSVQVDLGDGRVHTLAAIDACDDFRTDPITLDPSEPVTVLVHGCKSSTGRFRTLARVFRAHGRQTVCFAYDDRWSLERSSARLLTALDGLRSWTGDREITLVGHSQGGLVSRRALVEDRRDRRRLQHEGDIRLVTISAPFNGIRSSKHCGSIAFHIVTLGLAAMICQGIAGAKWQDIFPRAEFIRHPGRLAPDVASHLEIVTDEAGTCRKRRPSGGCAEDDFVFSLAEQVQPSLGADARVRRVQIRAGHSAVVGAADRPPSALVDVLREHRILPADGFAPAGLAALLARLY